MAIFKNPSRQILEGAKVVAKLISLSYGGQQNKIHLQKYAGLSHTNSATSLTNEITLANPLENIGVRFMRDICHKMGSKHGDGSSTSILMAHRGMAECFRLQSAPLITGSEIRDTLNMITPSGEITDLLRVVPCTHAQEIILNALQEIGEEGTILIQDGQKVEATLEFKDGMVIPFKLAHEKFQREPLEGAMVAVFNYPLCDERDITPVLEESSQWADNPLIIFTPYIVGDALRICLANQKHISNVCLVPAKVKPNQIESYLKDIASGANATFVCRNHLDVKNFDPSWFGFFRKVDFSSDQTEAIFYTEDEYVEARTARILELENEQKIAPTNYDVREIKKRISYLDGGVAIIGVGGHTESERKVNRADYEAWVKMAQSASSGVVADIRQTLTECAEATSNPVLRAMLLEPCKYLNAEKNPLGLEVLIDAINISCSIVNEYSKVRIAVINDQKKGMYHGR